MKRVMRITAVACALTLAGCATDDPNRRAKSGAAIGAIAGAVLGHQVQHSTRGRVVGAVIGAVAGGAIGNYMDNQQRDMERELADEQQRNELEIERMRDDSLKIGVSNEISFDSGRANLKPAFEDTLNKVADVIRKYDRTVVHVVGHTDSVGSDAYNMSLSRQRADRVADYLARQGVNWDRLRTEGRGEREPRADNATAAGRQLNRRVEIVVKPVVEGQEERAYEPPAASRPASWNG